jgi:hypothetical protein
MSAQVCVGVSSVWGDHRRAAVLTTPTEGKDMRRIRLIGLCIVAVFAMGAVATSSALAAPKALIDESTVTGGALSQEATTAGKQGFEVTVVTDATWGAMTQAEFGQYQLLIAGDPTCGTLPPGLVASAPVYGPVVLGLGGGRTSPGNKILVGTDPALHDFGDYETPGARGTIIREGIGFAGKQSGRTGMYFDSTCAANYYGQSTETLEILAALSTGSPSWTIDAEPPCGGNVSLIASNPSFSELTTASLEGWSCSVHESFPTFPAEWSALVVATDTSSHPTCGVDPNTGLSACGEAYILIAGSGTVVKSESIELTPAEATNPVGTDHTVTAHVTSGGSPLAGQTVTFTVTGQNAGASGTCVPAGCATDASGNVSFTYHDGNGAGEDTIKGSFTDASGSLQSATAKKTWTGGVADQAITASGTTVSLTEGAKFSGKVATFSDPDTSATASEYTATIEWGDSTSSTGTVSGSGGSFEVSGEHTYADEGSYAIKVTITDVDNASNEATANSTANVADAALSASGVTTTSPQSFSGTVAKFTDANTSSTTADFTATIDWGDGSPTSKGTVSGSAGSYSVSGSHTYTGTGYFTIKVHIVDDGGSTADATSKILIYGTSKGGNFVIGDKKAAIGTAVTFWGSNWWKLNPLSGYTVQISSFKGFEDNPATAACGTSWKTDPGNSTPPPAGPLPAYMVVVVSSKIAPNGTRVTGDTVHVVVVKTNPGYAPDPSHAGTGTVVAQIC